ncbi:MAG: NeuD/PglB/VioB family sugar acetyltransferase [Phycisphaerales bacterium]
MTHQPVILIGGGGHAGVVFDVCRAASIPVLGLLDDEADCPLARSGIAWLGPTNTPIPTNAQYIIAIGALALRRQIIDRLASDRAANAAIHPSAVVSPTAKLERGVVIMPGAVVNRNAHVGAHAIINTRAVIEHDGTVGENTHLAPGSVLGGNVSVGQDTLIGINTGVVPGVHIGEQCLVGAGSTVIGDITSGERVAGVPARSIDVVSGL